MQQLLKEIGDHNILLEVVDGELKIFTRESCVDPGIIRQIKQHKGALIQFLINNDQEKFRANYQATIPSVRPQQDYSLSPSQKRVWVLNQLDERGNMFNMPGVYRFEGNLDYPCFEASFALLIKRHEILRTIFRENETGEIRQQILDPGEALFSIGYADFSGDAAGEEALKTQVQESLSAPFDLATGPLIRISLLKTAEQQWICCLVMHHIISDAWSVSILVSELMQFYKAAKSGESLAPAPLKVQYKDYAEWKLAAIGDGLLQEQEDYWMKQLSGELPVLDFAGDHIRPAIRTSNGSEVVKLLDGKLINELRVFVQQHGCTLFMGLLAAVNALLYRYTRQEDIIIGTPVAGREHADLEMLIGFFVNTLALRTHVKGSDDFAELLDHTRQLTLDAFANQSYPFDVLIDKLSLQRDTSRNALFDVLVTLQRGTARRQEILNGADGLIISEEDSVASGQSRFDLMFSFFEEENDLRLILEYNSDIYSARTAKAMANHFERLLAGAIKTPLTAIEELDYLGVDEKEELLRAFTGVENNVKADKTIISLFEETVNVNPDKTALISGAVEMTYGELNAKANRFAQFLKARYQLQQGEFAGIKLSRSEWIIISILGILKSGGVYVPFDPDYPKDRVLFMLEDCKCKVLITEDEVAVFRHEEAQYGEENLLNAASPDDLAYIMYTSGSTGTPKGAMIVQKSVVRLVRLANYVSLSESDILLSTGAVSFDATTFEYWGMLLNGGTLVLCSTEELLDPVLLGQVIRSNHVNIMWFTAGWFNQLVDNNIELFSGLKTILAGGDKLSPYHIQRLLQHYPDTNIINGYGPTENTTFSLTCDVTKEMTVIPVGKPINNSTAYILDNLQTLVPIGITGEICVGGDGVALGYLNQPGLTNEKFIPDPFVPGGRMYRTGDIGRWLADGNIEFRGRMDDQVKIRGYRIEPGEIEHALLQYPGIEQAVVAAISTGQPGEKELIGYVVGKNDISTGAIRSFLARLMPVYMVPDCIIVLDSLPLSPNGKVDKRRLPHPSGAGSDASVGYVAPGNQTEEKLVRIWEEVLGRDNIGILDNFFDLGGHSLKAGRLAGEIHKVFDVKLSVKAVFSNAVLKDQALSIIQAKKTVYQAIERCPLAQDYPLSPAQYRLWVLSQFDAGNTAYNVPGAYIFEGALDPEALNGALLALIRRHESLRTVFAENAAGEIRQFIREPEASGFSIATGDLQHEQDQDNRVQALVQEAFISPFNLEEGPLVRAGLYRLGAERWLFIYVMHHIISDGWSMDILIRELFIFYNARTEGKQAILPDLRIQLKDYAAWKNLQHNNRSDDLHRTYWLDQFKGQIPILDMPTDRSRPVNGNNSGGVIRRVINIDFAEKIQAIAQDREVTTFMGLFALVNVLLYHYTRQEDIVIGTPVAGREHADLENLAGFCVNTLALRTIFSGADSFGVLLKNVKHLSLNAFEHQGYAFDELVDELGIQRTVNRNPLFDVMLVLQNTTQKEQQEPAGIRGLSMYEYTTPVSLISKFDLLFDFTEAEHGIRMIIQYNNDLYDRETISRMADHFEQLSNAVIENPVLPIRFLDIIGAKEKKALLETFNNTVQAYPADKTIIALFEHQVIQTPDAIALVAAGNEFTYQELNNRANRLGNFLRKKYHIIPDDRIGIKLERNEWLIVAILGVLKSGAAYVSLDPEYPRDRISFMLSDSGCKALVDERFIAELFGSAPFPHEDNPNPVNTPRDLHCIIYTSGSTGNPKGCMLEHIGVVNQVYSKIKLLGLKKEEVICHNSHLYFVGGIWQLWSPFVLGGKVILCSDDELKNIDAFLARARESRTNVIELIPSQLNEYLAYESGTTFPGIEKLVLTGEKLNAHFVHKCYSGNPGLTIFNGYGQTEFSNDTTSYEIPRILPSSNVPVGNPIQNTQIYILSPDQTLCPIGVIGEICTSGDGLSRGYINQPELTAEKYVANPFLPGLRMFRTGDMGRWLPDGKIEMTGRKDDLVKIRGFRIELWEIENALLQYQDISEVALLALDNEEGKEKFLAAFIVGKRSLNAAGIRGYLLERIPAYMLPVKYVQLERFPLLSNGKVNKKALPELIHLAMNTAVAYVAPGNSIEEKLVTIWQEILGKDTIGINDNFFELGGHSLKATTMLTRIKQHFNISMNLKEVFQLQDIHTLGKEIQKRIWAERSAEREPAGGRIREKIKI